ncbi:MAG TPA: glycoside hydrolase family 15 protein [Candidatus Dormibacteraeota bacterium]|nr:glycoside hydrolase family 15 protein [Candidatus Dormibacteraeota bacterium]
MPRRRGYLPLEQYGAIGDCRSMALVGSDGSIDWCCLPRFDSPSLFGRVLDARRGGFWQIAPVGRHNSRQIYVDKTNVLQTIFETPTGKAVVVDFMPTDAHDVRQHARAHPHPRVVRLVTGLAGKVQFRHVVEGAPGYGRATPLRLEDGRIHGDHDGHHFCVSATRPLRGTHQEFTLGPEQEVAFALASNTRGRCGQALDSPDHARRLLRATQDYWWRWVTQCTYVGPYQDKVWRSALALKLLTYAPTGAIVAAPTTSLPEWIGGRRNWDYRFTWIRDAAFTLYALFQLGFHQEAQDFMHWVGHLAVDRGLHNLYTLDGDDGLEERILDHLSGYRGSRPVRVGNAAAYQLQLDVYGELLDSAWLHLRNGGTISAELWHALHTVVDFAAASWKLPDASIWEVRGQNLHFTYSKAMCWAALDRGLRIAEATGLPADVATWTRARQEIHGAVLREGWSETRQAFTQSFGSDELDAAALRLVQLGFLRDGDPRLKSTIKAIDAELSAGPLVYRYRAAATDDGLASPEGSFIISAFWLADALALVGETEEAERRFASLLTFASPLGLFAEEVDPHTGALLGNYPQAFSHLSLISAAVNIERRRAGNLSRGKAP